jgi:hypothetical protein
MTADTVHPEHNPSVIVPDSSAIAPTIKLITRTADVSIDYIAARFGMSTYGFRKQYKQQITESLQAAMEKAIASLKSTGFTPSVPTKFGMIGARLFIHVAELLVRLRSRLEKCSTKIQAISLIHKYIRIDSGRLLGYNVSYRFVAVTLLRCGVTFGTDGRMVFPSIPEVPESGEPSAE